MSWITYSPNPAPILYSLTDKENELVRWIHEEFTKIGDAISQEITRWEDLRFPAANLKPGTSGVPTWDNTNGLHEFAVGDYIFFQAQMPHSWKVGTPIEPHLHWAKITSASGNVKWQLDYRISKIGEVWSSFDTISDETPDVSDNDTAYTHALTSLGEIDMTDDENISDMIIGKISRVAASGTEYGTRAALLEFDIHYQVDSFGSERTYIKGIK